MVALNFFVSYAIITSEVLGLRVCELRSTVTGIEIDLGRRSDRFIDGARRLCDAVAMSEVLGLRVCELQSAIISVAIHRSGHCVTGY